MKLYEAKYIVGKMVLWTMMSQGIEPNEKPNKITEDLETLLKANKIVDNHNKKLWKNILEKGKSESIQMVLDDRGIAAIYVAAKFEGTSTEDVRVLAKHDTNIVICLNEKELK